MTKVGFVGWRGMVGSVLLARMQAEGDFGLIEPHFFSTSNAGGDGPQIDGCTTQILKDANSVDALAAMDVVITCQGGDYTHGVFPKLRASGWSDDAIWQITALASFFNFSGRMEAASGLPADVIPDNASFKEAKAD